MKLSFILEPEVQWKARLDEHCTKKKFYCSMRFHFSFESRRFIMKRKLMQTRSNAITAVFLQKSECWPADSILVEGTMLNSKSFFTSYQFESGVSSGKLFSSKFSVSSSAISVLPGFLMHREAHQAAMAV